MGLIGRVFGAITGIPTASDRAMLDTLCLAAGADGDVSGVEKGYALEIALDLPGFQRVSRLTLERMLSESIEELRSTPSGDAIEVVRKRLDHHEEREQAYALVAVIHRVDGRVADTESAFLSRFREAMGVARERGQEILNEIERELRDVKDANLMNG